MKNMYSILTVLAIALILMSCTKNEETLNQNAKILGTWQLIESFSHPPTGDGWSQIENGFILNIKADGSFNSSQFSDCSTGNATITSNQLNLIYDCSGFTANFETPAGVFKYNYELVNGKLVLTPQNFNCFEGCKYRLVKI